MFDTISESHQPKTVNADALAASIQKAREHYQLKAATSDVLSEFKESDSSNLLKILNWPDFCMLIEHKEFGGTTLIAHDYLTARRKGRELAKCDVLESKGHIEIALLYGPLLIHNSVWHCIKKEAHAIQQSHEWQFYPALLPSTYHFIVQLNQLLQNAWKNGGQNKDIICSIEIDDEYFQLLQAQFKEARSRNECKKSAAEVQPV